ncbi:MAG: hypothetical protein ACPGJV_10580 [Bacteriovoracaceae bacterium]
MKSWIVLASLLIFFSAEYAQAGGKGYKFGERIRMNKADKKDDTSSQSSSEVVVEKQASEKEEEASESESFDYARTFTIADILEQMNGQPIVAHKIRDRKGWKNFYDEVIGHYGRGQKKIEKGYYSNSATKDDWLGGLDGNYQDLMTSEDQACEMLGYDKVRKGTTTVRAFPKSDRLQDVHGTVRPMDHVVALTAYATKGILHEEKGIDITKQVGKIVGVGYNPAGSRTVAEPTGDSQGEVIDMDYVEQSEEYADIFEIEPDYEIPNKKRKNFYSYFLKITCVKKRSDITEEESEDSLLQAKRDNMSTVEEILEKRIEEKEEAEMDEQEEVTGPVVIPNSGGKTSKELNGGVEVNPNGSQYQQSGPPSTKAIFF